MAQNYIISKHFPQINEYGGTDVIIDVLRKVELRGLIRRVLGERHARAEYDYSEGILSWFFTLCCGGSSLEHMHLNRQRLFNHPRFLATKAIPRYVKGMSPDTVSKMVDELKSDNEYVLKKSHQPEVPKAKRRKAGSSAKKTPPKPKSKFSHHQVNRNEKMNHLLLSTALELGLIKRNVGYVLDFDVTALVTKIKDARKFFDGDGKRAYCPAVASINDIPIFIENRNGDTPSSWNLTETLDDILKMLAKEGVRIVTLRIDGAAYVEEFIEYANKNGLKYVTRVRRDRGNKEALTFCDDEWEVAEIRGVEVEFAEKELLKGKSSQRLVVQHHLADDSYWALITNIRDCTKKEVCELYNLRQGADSIGEHIFESLKYQFMCKWLPHRTIEHNTVFLGIAAFCHVLYKYLIRRFHKAIKTLSPKIKLETFITKFVRGKTRWRGQKLILLDEQAWMYERLSGFT